MRALILEEYRRFALREAPDPRPAPDEVVVRVRACGICGSDVHGMDGSSGRRIPPLIMGHEAAGEIAEIGAAVSGWAAGDRVTFDSTVYCGQCPYCQRGEVNLCDQRQVLGVSCAEFRRNGAFAERVVVPARILYRLPDRLSFETAAMVEGVSVAVHAVSRAQVRPADSAIVVGAGMIGLLIIQVLRARGLQRVTAVDLDDSRLVMARKLGATDTVNSQHLADTPVLPIYDVAFEVVGLTPTVQLAITSVRKGGTVVLVGNLKPQVELPLQAVVTRQLSVLGTCASAGEYPECLELLASGQVRVTDFISATPPLEEGPLWFERLYAGEPGLMKVVLKP